MKYWLIKSEPTSYSIFDLSKKLNATDSWEGIRNYQVRNSIRDEIKRDDLGFFYHSSCKEPGIVGLVKVVKEAYEDSFALDPNSNYFDPRASSARNPWLMFDVQLVKIFKTPILLKQLKEEDFLQDLKLLQKGNRLSITSMSKTHWDYIIENFTIT